MTAAEWAQEILGRSKKNWKLIFPENNNLSKFETETALNDVAEHQRRREELFKPDEPEYQEQFWQSVKKEIIALP